MTASSTSDTLIQNLCSPACYPHPVKSVQVLETHISWVILAGRFAYKIKKPVNLGFLNFSELAMRRFYCEEEIRLNQRLAPGIYLEMVTIGGNTEHPVFGAEPAFEYAVKMRRFPAGKLMDALLDKGLTSPQQMDALAETLAKFHASLPAATIDSNYGSTESVVRPAEENFQQLKALLPADDTKLLSKLKAASTIEFNHCQALFEQRRRNGWIRECHGDLHLGNIVVLGNKPTPFDGIEFSPQLRWIDVINDIAFLIMDLQQRKRADLAFRCLNAYLTATGDYAGIGVLRFYLGYRAMVRAKVCAIRANQSQKSSSLAECQHYLHQAEAIFTTNQPALIITHGLPGCGKTTISQLVLEKIGAIRIRSDVERKRLFGITASQRSGSAIGTGIYSKEAGQHTYTHLLHLARAVLQSGFPLIIDAAFLQYTQRQPFRHLAREMNVPFVILSIHSDTLIQNQRIRQRQLGNDASEADTQVLAKLQNQFEPLRTYELTDAIVINNRGAIEQIADDPSLWLELDDLLRSPPSG